MAVVVAQPPTFWRTDVRTRIWLPINSSGWLRATREMGYISRVKFSAFMKLLFLALSIVAGVSTGGFSQTKPAAPAKPAQTARPSAPQSTTAASAKSVEKQKFVLLNNGATIGMVVNSVVKADKKRLNLTDQQLPKARQLITDATVKFNEGVKKLKRSGMNAQKLRVLAVEVESELVQKYKAILTPEQYAKQLAHHKKIYPESKAS